MKGSIHWQTRTVPRARARRMEARDLLYVADDSTTRICGPVGETTYSYDCEVMAVTECLRFTIKKQRKGAALPGVVIFTDYRALVQAL
ncbi:hypothetical protein PoB_003810400 [Plakobranchus ocellatus]|uniref:Reverse transcriptase RNase H-like domain-containing protein n=1 Tax=Plakobranchus ocellatus TaxID=259542 RepID=A0AAV4AUY1_9GAST|nr:hypothetical protein PoB_003810400 [Plakobranchus ocellatus]